MVSAKKICYIAVLTALTVVLSSFSIPVPGGHLYLNDTVICFAALAFDPFSAFIVGGIGAFLGDFFFYLRRCSFRLPRTDCRRLRFL